MGFFDFFRFSKRAAISASNSLAPDPAAEAVNFVEQGGALADAGQLDEAIRKYTAAIELAPSLASAHLGLGNALMATGEIQQAHAHYSTATNLKPDYAPALYNLGNAKSGLGRFEEAVACYQRALTLQPDFVEAEVALGNTLDDMQQFDAALASYERALRQRPESAPIRGNVCNVLLKLGRMQFSAGNPQGACDRFRAAVAAMPNNAVAHYYLGNATASLGQLQTALKSFAHALKLQPDFVDAEMASGTAQAKLNMFDQALQSFRRVSVLRPDHVAVYSSLADVLLRLGRLNEAAQSCRQALELDPETAEAHFNLGIILQAQGKWLDAHTSFRQAMVARNGFGEAVYNAYICANQLCDWSNRMEDEAAVHDAIARGSNGIRPFGLLGMEPPDSDAAQYQLQISRQFALQNLGSHIGDAESTINAIHGADGRLRVGYLSSDIHEHATMHLFFGVLAMHDRSKFKVHVYAHGTDIDSMTEKASRTCEVFRDLADWSDDDAAGRIALDEIDILVDLKGYTKGNRLEITARRPAPVVVSWLGYPGTLGHAGLADYIIGDAIVSPPANAAHFTETLALMPHCYQPNDGTRTIGPKISRAQAGLPDAAFVFCSFNQYFKFNPPSFDVWCNLLASVPGSVLWLLSTSQQAVLNLQREAEKRGIPANRLVFAEPAPLAQHLARLQLADLALDTFPYNSHTTGSDALWAGVPMVTLIGETFASRVAASMLSTVSLPELITHTWDEYFTLARSLALDPPRLSSIRQRLEDVRLSSPLFDTKRFTFNLERLFERIWEQKKRGVKETIVLQGTSE